MANNIAHFQIFLVLVTYFDGGETPLPLSTNVPPGDAATRASAHRAARLRRVHVHVQVVSTYAYCTCELLRTGRDAPPVSEDGLKVLSANGVLARAKDADSGRAGSASGFVCTR